MLPMEEGFIVVFPFMHSIKEAIVKVTGEGSYGILRTESGVHVRMFPCFHM